MFNTIDKLLFREVFKTLGVILVVLFLLLLGNYMVKFLGKVAEGSLSADVLFLMVGLEMLKILGRLIPPAFFFSILWVLGRMYRDSEMVALEACGVGPWQIYRSFAFSTIPLALLVSWLVMSVLPWAKNYSDEIKHAQKTNIQLAGIQPGQFTEFSRGDLVLYVGKIAGQGKSLEKIFVQHRKHGDLGLVMADKAHRYEDQETGDRFVVLRDGYRYEGEPGSNEYSVGAFGEYAFRLPRESRIAGGRSLSAYSWSELSSLDDIDAKAELQHRYSFILAVFAFAVISIPMARSLPRQQVYGKIGLAVLTYFIFMNLQEVAEHWMKDGVTAAWLGMWWVPLLMVIFAFLVTQAETIKFRHWFKHVMRINS